MFGDALWVTKEKAKEDLINTLAACAKAEEAGLTLTDEEKAQLNEN